MRRADLTQKAFAINCKQPESVISEALGGTRAFSVEWLTAHGDAFLCHFIDVMQEARHLTPEAREAVEDRDLIELFARVIRRRRTA